jgi:hypothetical protein
VRFRDRQQIRQDGGLSSGLASAFHAAIAAGGPIVASVPPSLTKARSGFANPLTIFVKPDYDVIEI